MDPHFGLRAASLEWLLGGRKTGGPPGGPLRCCVQIGQVTGGRWWKTSGQTSSFNAQRAKNYRESQGITKTSSHASYLLSCYD